MGCRSRREELAGLVSSCPTQSELVMMICAELSMARARGRGAAPLRQEDHLLLPTAAERLVKLDEALVFAAPCLSESKFSGEE